MWYIRLLLSESSSVIHNVSKQRFRSNSGWKLDVLWNTEFSSFDSKLHKYKELKKCPNQFMKVKEIETAQQKIAWPDESFI